MIFNFFGLMKKITICSVVILVLVPTLIMIGCDNESSSNTNSPEEILGKTIRAMDGLDSYRDKAYSFQRQSDQVNWESIPSEERELRSEYEFVSPDRHHSLLKADDRWTEVIVIGEQEWWRGESSHFSQLSWIPTGEFENGGFGVGFIDEFNSLKNFDDIQIIGNDILDGIDCYRLNFIKAFPEIPELDEITGYIWIDKKDSLVQQVASITPFQNDEDEMFEYIIKRYFDFNQPIEINPPLLDETESGDLPFPEGTFYKGPPSYDNLPSLVAPGSTTHLNEGQYYTIGPDSWNLTDEQFDELYARIYAKQSESLGLG
jgi:hypothetical protein